MIASTRFVLLLCLSGLLACPASRRGGGRGSSDDDDSAPGTIPASLDYTSHGEIHPTETGQTLGLSECSMDLAAVLELDADIEPCEGCGGVWAGSFTQTSTNCSGTQFDQGTRFGLTLIDGELDVWSWKAQEEIWEHSDIASVSGGGWALDSEEQMGEGDFLLGTVNTSETWR